MQPGAREADLGLLWWGVCEPGRGDKRTELLNEQGAVQQQGRLDPKENKIGVRKQSAVRKRARIVSKGCVRRNKHTSRALPDTVGVHPQHAAQTGAQGTKHNKHPRQKIRCCLT
jgi:hypothetical protein